MLTIIFECDNIESYGRQVKQVKNSYYFELKEIFENNEDLKKDHEKLFETISLICTAIEVQEESVKINKQLNELNSEKED